MMDSSVDDGLLQSVKAELRRAARLLMDRGLYFAAQWAAELVTQMKQPSSQPAAKRGLLFSPDSASSLPSSAAHSLPLASPSPPTPSSVSDMSSAAFPLPAPVDDYLLLAKSYFDLREYRRCAHLLESLPPSLSSPHHTFLRLYALYLAGEARKEEEQHEQPAGGGSASSSAHNRELSFIATQLQQSPAASDPFCLYLLALIFQQTAQPALALSSLLSSLSLFPCNWSAWLLLTSLVPDHHALSSLSLPAHFMRSFFLVHYFLEVHTEQTDLSSLTALLDSLLDCFPTSSHLLQCEAMSHYLHQHYDEAEAVLSHLHAVWPHRLQALDVYSNILFVKEDAATLSFLAHHLHRHHRYSHVSCCVIGNYYALKQQHARAVLYFRRAISLCPAYLSAYTLMGHEYIELHNQPAAITAYRTAVSLSPRDFRAWYGLGQAYELLGMSGVSVYYYRQAAALRPFDARMWCALGNGYERMNRDDEAVRCYERAKGEEDREGVAVQRLARLWGRKGEGKKAARYWRLVLRKQDMLERGEPEDEQAAASAAKDEARAAAEDGAGEAAAPNLVLDGRVSQSDVALEAVCYLAEWSRLQGDWEAATSLVHRMIDAGGAVKDQGKSLLIEIKNMQGKSGNAAAAAAGGTAQAETPSRTAASRIGTAGSVLTPLSERPHSGRGRGGEGGAGGFFSPPRTPMS